MEGKGKVRDSVTSCAAISKVGKGKDVFNDLKGCISREASDEFRAILFFRFCGFVAVLQISPNKR